MHSRSLTECYEAAGLVLSVVTGTPIQAMILSGCGHPRCRGNDGQPAIPENMEPLAATLGYSAAVADLDTLRRSPAADYLLQTTMTDRGARPVTRLFHQALTDELLAARHQPSDESVLVDMLLEQARRTGWQDRYLCDHAAEHAAAAGRLDQLLEDPLYLITVDPPRLVPHLDAARSGPARAAATVYRQSAHQLADIGRLAQASQLELTAQQVGCRDLAARIAAAAPDRPWQTPWSHSDWAAGHQVLTGHTGAVTAVAVGALPDSTPVC